MLIFSIFPTKLHFLNFLHSPNRPGMCIQLRFFGSSKLKHMPLAGIEGLHSGCAHIPLTALEGLHELQVNKTTTTNPLSVTKNFKLLY